MRLLRPEPAFGWVASGLRAVAWGRLCLGVLCLGMLSLGVSASARADVARDFDDVSD